MDKIYKTLLSIRDSYFIKTSCIHILLKNEFFAEEIRSYRFIQRIPSIELSDGTILSSYESHRSPDLKKFKIPSSHMTCILNYILRFKYPHFRPDLTIRTAPVPRRIFPSIIHRQHLNTFYDICEGTDSPEKLADIFSVRKGSKVLELGSFIGMGTVNLSKMTGSKGGVISVEADQKAFFNLTLNLENNHIQNVRSINCAVSDKDTDKELIFKDVFQKNSIIKGVIDNQKTETIKSKRVETICKENDFDPDFIIMTINGAEYKVLQNSLKFLKKLGSLRIVVPGWYKDQNGLTGPRIISLLKDANFQVAFTKGMHIFAYKN
jgi:FkbM family methyltransferase